MTAAQFSLPKLRPSSRLQVWTPKLSERRILMWAAAETVKQLKQQDDLFL